MLWTPLSGVFLTTSLYSLTLVIRKTLVKPSNMLYIQNSGKYMKSERSSSKENSTAPARLRFAHNIIPEPVYAPSAYNKFPSHYPPLQSNYPLQYSYPFHHYAPCYPYPPQYPYPSHNAMAPYPPIYKGQNSPTDHSWQGQRKLSGSITPPRPVSPGSSANLNFHPTRRSDAVTSQTTPRGRPRSIRLQENSVGSFDQDLVKKTHQ